MKPEYMPTTAAQRRFYLIEELGELLSALGKAGRWGMLSVNPELPRDQQVTNAAWIKHEMADVRRALDMFEPYVDSELLSLKQEPPALSTEA